MQVCVKMGYFWTILFLAFQACLSLSRISFPDFDLNFQLCSTRLFKWYIISGHWICIYEFGKKGKKKLRKERIKDSLNICVISFYQLLLLLQLFSWRTVSFFCCVYRFCTIFLNLLRLKCILKETRWHKNAWRIKVFPIYLPCNSTTTFVTPVKLHMILDMLHKNDNFYKERFRTNIGKTMFSAQVVDHWQKLPQDIKDLRLPTFPRKGKQYLLSKQI